MTAEGRGVARFTVARVGRAQKTARLHRDAQAPGASRDLASGRRRARDRDAAIVNHSLLKRETGFADPHPAAAARLRSGFRGCTTPEHAELDDWTGCRRAGRVCLRLSPAFRPSRRSRNTPPRVKDFLSFDIYTASEAFQSVSPSLVSLASAGQRLRRLRLIMRR